jgi:hypothetical protein
MRFNLARHVAEVWPGTCVPEELTGSVYVSLGLLVSLSSLICPVALLARLTLLGGHDVIGGKLLNFVYPSVHGKPDLKHSPS